MKRYLAVFVLLGLFVSGGAVLLAQERSGGPSLEEQLRQAQGLLQRLRSSSNIPQSDLTNSLRELERLMVQLQRSQESAQTGAGGRGAPGTITRQPVNGNPDLVDEIRLVLGADNLVNGRAVVRVSRTDMSAWWTNAALVARLGLTDDQKSRIERAFEASRQNLEASKAQLEKDEGQLDKLLAADPLDHAGIVTQINRVIQSRGEMERVNSLMTLEMREVLTAAQWTQLQSQTTPSTYVFRTPAGTTVPPAGQPGLRGGGQRGPAPTAPR